MFNQLIDLRTQGIQKLLIAAIIGLFAVTATIASPSISRAEAVQSQTVTNDALLQKQSEIDSYVFEKHADELEKQGIHVTNTGAVGNVVEIGITDYTDEKANYLYGIFGKDLVKVVEGQQAVPLNNNVVSTTSVGSTTTDEAGSSASQYVLWAILLAAVVAIGALFSRKLRVSKR
jgi:hypothetical protein